MSDIRFNQWLHNSGTGGVSQVDGGHVGIGTTNPEIAVHSGNNKILNVGIVTASTYYGDGSNLTGITDNVVTINNNADNKIITGSGSANTLEAETNLTFSGSTLKVNSTTGHSYLKLTSNNSYSGTIHFGDQADDDAAQIWYDNYQGNGMYLRTSENTPMSFYTNSLPRLVITNAGELIIGGQSSAINPDNYASSLQVHGTATDAGISILRYSNNSGSPTLLFGKSRGASIGSFATVQNNDSLGKIEFYGTDTGWESSASIRASADGEWYSGSSGSEDNTDAPGRLEFHTTPDGADNLQERLRITSDGKVVAGGNGTGYPCRLQSHGAGDLLDLNSTSGAGIIRFYESGVGRFNIETLNGSSGLRFYDSLNGAERLRINSSGQILIGTTQQSISSSELFEVKSNSSGFSHFRNNHSGYAPIYIDNEYTNTAMAPLITFTDGGGNRAGFELDPNSLFRITGQGGIELATGGTLGNATPKMRMFQAGNIWIGYNNSPQANYSVGKGFNFMPFTGDSVWVANTYDSSVAGNTPGVYNYNLNSSYGGVRFYPKVDGGLVNYSSSNSNLCDERAKKDIVNAPSYWSSIKSIEIKNFRYKNEPDNIPLKVGVITQQVESIEPNLVDEDFAFDGDPNDTNTTFYKSVHEEQLMMMAIKALQEAQTRIETLEQENIALKTRVAALESS